MTTYAFWNKCKAIIHMYIIFRANPLTGLQHIFLTSFMLCGLRFMHEYWDQQFKVDFKRQFLRIFSWKEEAPKKKNILKYFFSLHMSDLCRNWIWTLCLVTQHTTSYHGNFISKASKKAFVPITSIQFMNVKYRKRLYFISWACALPRQMISWLGAFAINPLKVKSDY